MPAVTIQSAQSNLPDLIRGLRPGDEVTITENSRPVAKLVAVAATGSPHRMLGTQRGSVLFMSTDFDAPISDFHEYME